MPMDQHYGGIIWTHHAIKRLHERNIAQGDAWATWRNPDHSRKGTSSGSWVYYRTWKNTQVEVVAKQNEKKEWIVLSVWSRYVGNKPVQRESIVRRVVRFLFRV